jgi:hypothetical protein
MPDILTLERVAECRERAERATKGPWEAKCSGHDYPYIVAHGKQLACGEDFGKMPDAEFCAHARTDIPALCATVEALREVVEWQCRTKCAGYSSECTDRCRAAQVFRARELSR